MKTEQVTSTMPKQVKTRAEEAMRVYVQSAANKKKLMDSIANEMKAYEENMKNAQTELVAIGEANKGAFDSKGNLDLGAGYLHLASETVIVEKRKFDMLEFAKSFPDFVKITKLVAPIKKAFLDRDQRKDVAAFGIDVDTVESVEVKIYKV